MPYLYLNKLLRCEKFGLLIPSFKIRLIYVLNIFKIKKNVWHDFIYRQLKEIKIKNKIKICEK